MDEFNRNSNEETENTGTPEAPETPVIPETEAPAEEVAPAPENASDTAVSPEAFANETEDAAPVKENPALENAGEAFVPPFGNEPNPEPEPEPEPAVNTQPQQPQYRPPYQPQPQPQPQPHVQYQPQPASTGEYRYVPPKTENRVNTGAYGYAGAHVTYQPAAAPKPKKEKKTFSAGAVALIIVACVLLSFGAGMMGAFLVTGGEKVVDEDESDALVIYRTVKEDDEEAPAVPGKEMSVKDVCAKVAASVVEIETEFKNSYGFYQYVSAGAGSGVIISKDGYLITNNHVIFNSNTNAVADNVTVRLNNGTEYKAKIIGRDADADIALLKVDAKDLAPAVVGDSSKIAVGETVIAVGNPLGELGGTVTCGIISATNREISVENNRMNLIQIDAAVNPGNSGGGMFNMKGELVGIVNSGVTGSDVDGLGFGIPINDATAVIEELKTHGYVTGKTYLGISPMDVTDIFTAYRYFNSQQTGVYIAQVQEGYNDKVLKYGDRIVAIDGDEVTSSEDIREALKSHKVGDTMTFSISREGRFMDVTVTCYEYVPDSEVTFTEN